MSDQCLLFSGSHTFFQILLHWSLMPYFFPFLRHSLDLIGKMKQYVERPIWLPCNSVDLSSIGKQKLCFKKKIHAWDLFKTTLRQKLYQMLLQILFGAVCFHLSIPGTSSSSMQTRGAQKHRGFPLPIRHGPYPSPSTHLLLPKLTSSNYNLIWETLCVKPVGVEIAGDSISAVLVTRELLLPSLCGSGKCPRGVVKKSTH